MSAATSRDMRARQLPGCRPAKERTSLADAHSPSWASRAPTKRSGAKASLMNFAAALPPRRTPERVRRSRGCAVLGADVRRRQACLDRQPVDLAAGRAVSDDARDVLELTGSERRQCDAAKAKPVLGRRGGRQLRT